MITSTGMCFTQARLVSRGKFQEYSALLLGGDDRRPQRSGLFRAGCDRAKKRQWPDAGIARYTEQAVGAQKRA